MGADRPDQCGVDDHAANPPEEISGVEGASFIIRATFEVAPDGQSLTADYTVEPGGMEWIPAGLSTVPAR